MGFLLREELRSLYFLHRLIRSSLRTVIKSKENMGEFRDILSGE